MKNKLRIQRAIYDVNMEELAQAVGVTRQTIHAIENNKYSPSLMLAMRICDFFGQPVNEVFTLEPEDKKDIKYKEKPD